MPELPEVETIRKGLINLVGGAVIIDVAAFWDRMITPPFHGTFQDGSAGGADPHHRTPRQVSDLCWTTGR